MAKCAYCDQIVIFGGRRVGATVFCSTRCMLNGRELLDIDEKADADSLRSSVRDLRDALLVLAEQVEHQQLALSDVAERLDFAERALAQLRGGVPGMEPRAAGPSPDPPGVASRTPAGDR